MGELDAGGEASGLATRRLGSLVMWTPRFKDLCGRALNSSFAKQVIRCGLDSDWKLRMSIK